MHTVDELPDPFGTQLPRTEIRQPTKPQASANAAPCTHSKSARTESIVKLPPKEQKPVARQVAPKQGDIVVFTAEESPRGNFVVESVEESGNLIVAHEDGSRWGCRPTSVKVVRDSTRRSKVSLADEPVQLDESQLDVTIPLLEGLGFTVAPKEDFIGAGDKTLFIDVETQSGVSTIVYDMQPLGSAVPAAHLYYRSREGGICESAACFSAKCTIADVKQLLSVAETMRPKTGEKNKRIKSMKDLIEHLKLRSTAE